MSETYEKLAALLEYPDKSWDARVENARRVSGAFELSDFIACIEQLPLPDIQELYTRTFDLNPVCALEVGYHLFGENYKRGEFLANLRETESQFELGQQNQLPDYLPVLLRLLNHLVDGELRLSLISECLIPAIGRMLAAMENGENPYRRLLETIRITLMSEPGVEVIETNSFMRASLPIFPADVMPKPSDMF